MNAKKTSTSRPREVLPNRNALSRRWRDLRSGKIMTDFMFTQTVTRALSRLGLDQWGTAVLTRSEV